MLYHEIYGVYYECVQKILNLASKGLLTQKSMLQTVREAGFLHSDQVIPEKLQDGSWPLLRDDLSTPLPPVPEMPLTLLEKQWLKTLCSDPRFRLFRLEEPELLTGVSPLFDPSLVWYYDQYADGDPYTDEDYINHFQDILLSLRTKTMLEITFHDARGIHQTWEVYPIHLEYSLQDDKFRLDVVYQHQHRTLNLARITSVQTLSRTFDPKLVLLHCLQSEKCEATLRIRDERGTLSRVLTTFSWLEKETDPAGEEGVYLLRLRYDQHDESELLIRILSFGQHVQVLSPSRLVDLIRQRLLRQQERLLRPYYAQDE
ncbi:MAG: WYL domain-containing protein [Clostridia bacterium]|nr:WYL domain-containing protein [Clostridia bacterium]